jgi:hypothetical protein
VRASLQSAGNAAPYLLRNANSRAQQEIDMKKLIAAFLLAAAAASPAVASDYIDTSTWMPAHDSMSAYASAPRGNWQAAQDANIRHQSQIQWQITDR